jgi:aspartate kinase
MTFTVPRGEFKRALQVIEGNREKIAYQELLSTSDVTKVSIIGVGMRSHVGVARKMFETLSDKGINIQVISTSEIKVSVLIAEEYTELAVRALHTAYGLDAD